MSGQDGALASSLLCACSGTGRFMQLFSHAAHSRIYSFPTHLFPQPLFVLPQPLGKGAVQVQRWGWFNNLEPIKCLKKGDSLHPSLLRVTASLGHQEQRLSMEMLLFALSCRLQLGFSARRAVEARGGKAAWHFLLPGAERPAQDPAEPEALSPFQPLELRSELSSSSRSSWGGSAGSQDPQRMSSGQGRGQELHVMTQQSRIWVKKSRAQPTCCVGKERMLKPRSPRGLPSVSSFLC